MKPWKPNFGDVYYFVGQSGNVYHHYYNKTREDIIFYKIGNCYATKEEAKANKDKWIRFYEADEILEI